MKVVKLIALLACAALLAPSAVRAEDAAAAPARNFHFSIGYKLWLTTWTTWDTDVDGNQFSLTDGPTATSVPNLSFRWHNWLAAGSYVSTGNFKFPRFTDTVCFGASCTYLETRDYSAKRTEWDMNLGYFLPTSEGSSLAITAGYKSVSQKFDVVYGYPLGGGAGFNSNFNFDVAGPTLGILGSASIGHGFSLYGNGVGGWVKVKHDTNNSFGNGIYEAAELGMAWHPQTVPLQLSFGYKYQVLETSFKQSKNKGEDLTRGYTLGIAYTF